jgi:hypothetical protein
MTRNQISLNAFIIENAGLWLKAGIVSRDFLTPPPSGRQRFFSGNAPFFRVKEYRAARDF